MRLQILLLTLTIAFLMSASYCLDRSSVLLKHTAIVAQIIHDESDSPQPERDVSAVHNSYGCNSGALGANRTTRQGKHGDFTDKKTVVRKTIQ